MDTFRFSVSNLLCFAITSLNFLQIALAPFPFFLFSISFPPIHHLNSQAWLGLISQILSTFMSLPIFQRFYLVLTPHKWENWTAKIAPTQRSKSTQMLRCGFISNALEKRHRNIWVGLLLHVSANSAVRFLHLWDVNTRIKPLEDMERHRCWEDPSPVVKHQYTTYRKNKFYFHLLTSLNFLWGINFSHNIPDNWTRSLSVGHVLNVREFVYIKCVVVYSCKLQKPNIRFMSPCMDIDLLGTDCAYTGTWGLLQGHTRIIWAVQ